jgi:hypothetical protein
MPLSVYYHGRNVLVPVPRPPSYAYWDQSTFVIHGPEDVARVLEESAPGAAGLWVHTNKYGKHWGYDQLEIFLARNYRQDERQDFARGVVLRHFVPNQAGPALANDPP